ncbi:MAG: ABC transporter substrate-binding protein, partial [Defluviitaleaceae bacterium]|nr:ABC transporter substrate-binding protein [Defluviitaleaceae bacterium]
MMNPLLFKKIGIICLASLFFLTACNSGNSEELPNTVRIAINTEPDSLHPHLSATADTASMMNNVFEGLVGIDENANIIPKIAHNWTISYDGLLYTFTIRDDIYFHNGERLTIDDVLFSLNRLAGLDGEPPASSRFNTVVAIEQTSENVVTITLSERNASFLVTLTAAIIPRNYHEQSTHPIGTGPYKFVSYTPGQNLILALNPNYYDPANAGTIENAEFVFMTDDSAQLLALRSGSIHMFRTSGEIIEQINEQEFATHRSPSNSVQLLALNNDVFPFNDVRVRQALNYAVNREEVSLFITNGTSNTTYTTLTPELFWYNQETENIFAHNIERAKELLQEAGLGGGFNMEITVPSNYAFHVDTAQVLVEQLLSIGVNAEIRLVEWGIWLDEVHAQRNYQSTIVALAGRADPHEVFQRFHSEWGRNFVGFNNPEYDRLVDLGLVETDLQRRIEIY